MAPSADVTALRAASRRVIEPTGSDDDGVSDNPPYHVLSSGPLEAMRCRRRPGGGSRRAARRDAPPSSGSRMPLPARKGNDVAVDGGAEDQDSYRGALGDQGGGRGDAIHAGRVKVHQDHVGLEAPCCRDDLGAVGTRPPRRGDRRLRPGACSGWLVAQHRRRLPARVSRVSTHCRRHVAGQHGDRVPAGATPDRQVVRAEIMARPRVGIRRWR